MRYTIAERPTVARQALRTALPLALLIPSPGLAQGAVRLDAQGARVHVVNELPLRIVGLVRDATDASRPLRRVIAVDGAATADVPGRPSALTLELFEVISRTVALRQGWTAPCTRFDASGVQASIRTLQSELAALPLDQRREGQRALQIAASVAQLRHEEFRDSLNLIRYDPTSLWMQREVRSNGTYNQVRKMEEEIHNDELQRNLAEMGRAITIYAEQTRAKYQLLARDAARYRELATATERTLASLQARIPLIQGEVSRFGEYQRLAVEEITKTAPAAGEPSTLVTSELRRSCPGAAAVNDIFELRMQTQSELAVLAGEVTFDHGTPQTVLLRREKGTDRWIGRLAWPAEGTTGRLRVRAPGASRWNTVDGVLRSNRMSFTSLHATLATQYAEAKRLFAEANNRAKGSDHTQTLIVP